MNILEKSPVVTILYKKDNNLEQKDNLDTLPNGPAVYGIFGRINGEPANCRHVAATKNLKQAILHHFSDSESYDCLRTFMQSIKIKMLVYQELDASADFEDMKLQWEARYKPECNEQLNHIH